MEAVPVARRNRRPVDESRPVPVINITLRPIEVTDVDDFLIWATDEKVTRFTRFDTYTSRDQAIEFITNSAIPHPWFKAICIGNKAIGSISVTPNPMEGRRRAELGYVLGYDHWGKGIGTNAVKMVVSKIFEEWSELERLEATVDLRNIGSQRVLQKAGFHKEGILRKYLMVRGTSKDLVMFSILSTDHP